MTRVLIVSNDIIDQNMGGVGVRFWEIAHALASNCQVILAVPNGTKLTSSTVSIVSFDLRDGDLSEYAKNVDLLIIQGFVLHFHPYLRDLGIPMAVDLYVPSLLEGLVWHDHDDWSTWIPAYEEYLRVQLELLRAGDFFFCASERQRDYWLGWLHAQKRINPHTYHEDPTLRKLIDVVPFGLPDATPAEQKRIVKGVRAGFPENAFLLLWGGGLWDWLDPLTLIRTVAELSPRYPELRLLFMGSRHPNASVSGMTMTDQAIELSQNLGLYNRIVFFNDWVPYHERFNYLREADLGVVTHLDHIETHFSFRTRILDCIWAGLPIITTQGDALAEEVVKAKAGLSVPPGDVLALAQAIETMIANGSDYHSEETWERLRERYRWKNVVAPLVEFCEHPRLAPDKSKYLTETERIGQAKDEFLQQVIHDKDEFLEKVIHDKDEFLEKVVQDRDKLFQQVCEERDLLKTRIDRYEKHRILRMISHLFIKLKI